MDIDIELELPRTEDPETALATVRRRIEDVDEELVRLIARRCRLARLAGTHKLDAALPLCDPGQEARVVRRVAERSRTEGIGEEEAVRRIFWCLIELSRRIQAPAAGTAPSGVSGEAR